MSALLDVLNQNIAWLLKQTSLRFLSKYTWLWCFLCLKTSCCVSFPREHLERGLGITSWSVLKCRFMVDNIGKRSRTCDNSYTLSCGSLSSCSGKSTHWGKIEFKNDLLLCSCIFFVMWEKSKVRQAEEGEAELEAFVRRERPLWFATLQSRPESHGHFTGELQEIGTGVTDSKVAKVQAAEHITQGNLM